MNKMCDLVLDTLSPDVLFDLAWEHDVDIWLLEAAERGGLPDYLDNENKRENENFHDLNALLDGSRAPRLNAPPNTPKECMFKWSDLEEAKNPIQNEHVDY